MEGKTQLNRYERWSVGVTFFRKIQLVGWNDTPKDVGCGAMYVWTKCFFFFSISSHCI
jgi:hypothetical protein